MGSADRDAAVTHLTSARAPTASALLPHAAVPPVASAPLEPPSRRGCPRAPRAKELARPCARASRGRGGATPPPPESSEAKPSNSLPRHQLFHLPFSNSANGPQPTGPGCFAGQSACGLVGKVEGGDVSGNSCLRWGGGGARAPRPRASEPRRVEVLDPRGRERVKAG